MHGNQAETLLLVLCFRRFEKAEISEMLVACKPISGRSRACLAPIGYLAKKASQARAISRDVVV